MDAPTGVGSDKIPRGGERPPALVPVVPLVVGGHIPVDRLLRLKNPLVDI
ncbi:MAG: hypothetical protein OXC62_17675 [Aestuariivita sp.]|nr:hypothetical protein [Aestuariivita sp.]